MIFEFINPSVTEFYNEDVVQHVAECARVCYASEPTDDRFAKNIALYNSLIKRKHLSMLRHATYYFKFSKDEYNDDQFVKFIAHSPYNSMVIDGTDVYVAINGHFNYLHKVTSIFNEHSVTREEIDANPTARRIMRYTFVVVCNISISRELNRVSPNNIAEQSTRYVNFGNKTIQVVKPYWYDSETDRVKLIYKTALENSFTAYNKLSAYGLVPQFARGVLPLDTATKCIYTYSTKEWNDIVEKRYFGSTGTPHPDAKVIGELILKKLIEHNQIYFIDKQYLDTLNF